jgi:hypothetical protein
MGKHRGRPLARRVLDKFWAVLDSESVIPFQLMYYFIFFTAGVYGVFIAGGSPPLTLVGAMSHISIQLWYWMNIIGPGMGFLGLAVRRTRFSYAGVWVMAGGNFMFGMSLIAYMIATFQMESWGRGMYGAFPLATSSFASTFFLVIRDLRRIILTETRLRHGWD